MLITTTKPMWHREQARLLCGRSNLILEQLITTEYLLNLGRKMLMAVNSSAFLLSTSAPK
jgi:hypothetical protein